MTINAFDARKHDYICFVRNFEFLPRKGSFTNEIYVSRSRSQNCMFQQAQSLVLTPRIYGRHYQTDVLPGYTDPKGSFNGDINLNAVVMIVHFAIA